MFINTKFDLSTAKNNEEGLTSEEKQARLKIIEEMASRDSYIPFKDLDIAENLLKSLDQKGLIVKDSSGEQIRFAYPVSGDHTQHEISLEDGRIFHSMCAIDSLGSTFTFGQDLKIRSECSTSGQKVEIDIKDQAIHKVNSDDIYVIHVDLNEGTDWFASCWNDMNFFRGKNNLIEYYKSNQLDPNTSFALTLDEAFEIGKETFTVEKTLREYEEVQSTE